MVDMIIIMSVIIITLPISIYFIIRMVSTGH